MENFRVEGEKFREDADALEEAQRGGVLGAAEECIEVDLGVLCEFDQ